MEAYLDNAATTRCSEKAAQAVTEAMTVTYGNPSSMHRKGMEAERIVKDARETIAKTLRAKEKEIVFTSGGTESNNLAIFGAVQANRRAGRRILTSAIEHPAVRNPMKALQEQGYEVIFLPVDAQGVVSLKALEKEANAETALVSLMQVNNEIGTVEPIAEASKIIREKAAQAYFHVDAIQAYGKRILTPEKTGIDLLSVSGHKIHGPKGVGFLYIRERTKLIPQILGGGQQWGLRSGTENVPGIAGLAAAAEESCRGLAEKEGRMRTLRAQLITGLQTMEDILINGGQTDETASPYITSVSVSGVRSEVLLHALEEEGVYVSAGSACASNKPAVSETLKAIGLPEQYLSSTVRFSFSAQTTEEEIAHAVDAMQRIVPKLRKYTRK
ncbi:MAG: cysteine desulfurase [Lachnospiraceae bacterium]|nr:cysteine desulfurase [Lachnospiraceae bacterium]